MKQTVKVTGIQSYTSKIWAQELPKPILRGREEASRKKRQSILKESLQKRKSSRVEAVEPESPKLEFATQISHLPSIDTNNSE
jgi:hypothetical protein